MNKTKIDNYYKPESKTLILNDTYYTVIPNGNIKSLNDNWNKLKEYIKETKLKEFEKSYGKRYGRTFTQAEIVVCNMILDKMQEIEQEREDVSE